MVEFRCQFPPHQVQEWASKYGDPAQDRDAIEAGARARRRGHLTRDEFLRIGGWKSARPVHLQESNADAFVEEVTRVALSTPDERLRIEVLTLLRGVAWPTASCILHLAHADRYPVLDFRALGSVGISESAAHDFHLWNGYTQYCRALADQAGCDMRTLDRALWGFSAHRSRAR